MIVATLGFFFGIVLGSFLKATSERLDKNLSLYGRSYCLSCKHQLKWYDLFPILSYLTLFGKCRYCQSKIPLSTFITEVVSGVIFALLFYLSLPHNPETLLILTPGLVLILMSLLFKVFVISVLIIVFLTDIATGYIYDRLIIPSVIAAFSYLIIEGLVKTWYFYQSLAISPVGKYLLPPHSSYFLDNVERIWVVIGLSLLSAIAAGGFFLFLLLITRGRGMGGGDVKFVFFLGLALGFPNTTIGLFLAFFLGAVFGVILLLIGKKKFGQTIPFGPFLSLGSFIAMLFGTPILNWYLISLKLPY